MEDSLRLEDYHVSPEIGFMLKNPLVRLPTYFEPWHQLCDRIDNLIESHSLRNEIIQLPELDHTKLRGHRELRLAHLVLSNLSHGYIWQEGDEGVEKVLPRCIAVPWYRISESLGIKPVFNHVDGVLSNYIVIAPERPLCLDNIKYIHNTPGGKQCEWFFLVTVQIELNAAQAMKGICCVLNGVHDKNSDQIRHGLEDIRVACNNIRTSLSRMHENLEAGFFYNMIRPYLAGWGGNSSALPDGLVYEGVSDKPIKMIGGSAAQSPSFQAMDAALGIVHEEGKMEFLNEMMEYMLPPHKEFILAIRKSSSIRKYVESCDDLALRESYNHCVETLKAVRAYHIQIVAKYVIVASHKIKNKYENLAKVGTGGQSPMPFLKSIRDTTRTAKIN